MKELKRELEEIYGEIHIASFEEYGNKVYMFMTRDGFVVATAEVKR